MWLGSRQQVRQVNVTDIDPGDSHGICPRPWSRHRQSAVTVKTRRCVLWIGIISTLTAASSCDCEMTDNESCQSISPVFLSSGLWTTVILCSMACLTALSGNYSPPRTAHHMDQIVRTHHASATPVTMASCSATRVQDRMPGPSIIVWSATSIHITGYQPRLVQ